MRFLLDCDIAGDIMAIANLIELDRVKADLMNRMGEYCSRSDIESIAARLGREASESVPGGTWWSSTMAAVANDLYIADCDPLEPMMVNGIITLLLSQDVPAWSDHLREKEARGDYDYGN